MCVNEMGCYSFWCQISFSILFGLILYYLHLEFENFEEKKLLCLSKNALFLKIYRDPGVPNTREYFFAYFRWSVIAWNGSECWIVGFRKLPKLTDTTFLMLMWGKCWR